MWLSSHAVSANSLPTAASSLETPPEGMLWALAVLLALWVSSVPLANRIGDVGRPISDGDSGRRFSQ